jgi:uncharacterized glyoxalase superfamily protein PhnB
MKQQVIPMLSYEDVGRAADWLTSVFGFAEDSAAAGQQQYRAEDIEGHRWMFAQPT